MEAVGLAVGVVGLAGLFSACIDCFELVQRGRYHGKDYLLLETKFTNQRLRLTSWGRACGFLDSGSIDDQFGEEQIEAPIKATLTHLITLFTDGQALRSKYGLKDDQQAQSILALVPASFGALVPSNFSSKSRLGQKLHELRRTTYRTQKDAKLGSKVRWAIENRSKFTELIRDTKDLIDDLEGLTRWLNVPERQRRNIQCEVESIYDLTTLETMEEARVGRIDAVSDAASVRLWQLRDQFLEPAHEGVASVRIQSSQASVVSIEDDWNAISQEAQTLPNNSSTCYQVLHRVTCPHEQTSIFLDQPSYSTQNCDVSQWAVLDEDRPMREPMALHMCGRRPVPDLEGYMTQNHQLAFVVFKNYRCSHDKLHEENAPPQSLADSIYLWAPELCTDLVRRFGESVKPSYLAQFQPKSELHAPYHWYYHSGRECGDLIEDVHEGSVTRRSIEILLKFICTSMVAEYGAVDDLISEKQISWRHLPYIYGEGNIVLRSYGNGRDHCQAFEIDSLKPEGSFSWRLNLHTLQFDGAFKRTDLALLIDRSQFGSSPDAHLPMASLPAMPIVYVEGNMRQYLVHRGQKFWAYRQRQLIKYTGYSAGSSAFTQHDRRFMIDTPMYHRMSASAINNPHVRVTGDEAVTQVSLDICPEDTLLLMLPATVYGYDLYDHRWSELLVSNISDVAWNARIFDQLTMSNNDKNLVQAMATWPKANDTTWTSTRNSGGRHVLLLHGAPGSGKTYTAKAIAEITRRPLYRISCSDVGTNVSTAEDYMRSVSEICNAWDCVVLFDDAEIFFEQRTMHDMERNAMVVTFLRCLDFFTGLVILTTNRVGTFDETVRSRVQLVIYLEQWNYDERVKIWKTVISDLVSFTDHNQIDKLMSDIYLFAEWKLNGWEVDNMVKMAMQLACSQDECLSRRHFQQVFKNSEEFIAYIAEVNGTDMGTIARGRRER